MRKKYYSEEEVASRSELEAIQLKHLQDMVRRVYENVPFYRKALDETGIRPEDIRSLDDLKRLPFTTKQDLRDTYPYGLFAVDKGDLARIHASSGTTGRQTVVGYTKNDLRNWGTMAARALVAAGATREDFVHVSYGYGLFTGGFGLHAGADELGCTVIPVSTGNTARQIKILQEFGSDIIGCTPSYAMYIGETVREMGIDPKSLKLRAGIFGAEPWTEQMRKRIEELLDIKAYDIYGLSEVLGPGVSYECSEQSGMHVNEDHFIVEIIDPDTGEVLPYGEEGELVFTCITKEALPLIRYRTRDIASLSIAPCPCGRTFVKMSKPHGRTDDMLIIRGVNVFPSQVESVLLGYDYVTANYQLVISREGALDQLEIFVELREDVQFDTVRELETKQKELRSAIESVLNVSAQVRLVSPHSIARSEGKAKRVLDKRSQ